MERKEGEEEWLQSFPLEAFFSILCSMYEYVQRVLDFPRKEKEKPVFHVHDATYRGLLLHGRLLLLLFCFSAVAPEIAVPSQLYGVAPGTNVNISCKVQAYPSAISYWMKDDREMLLDG